MANVARKKEKSGNGFIIVLLLRLFNARNIFGFIDNNVITRDSVAAPTERTSSFSQLNIKSGRAARLRLPLSYIDGRNKSPRQRTWII